MCENVQNAKGILYRMKERTDVGFGDEETDGIIGITEGDLNDGSGTENSRQLSSSELYRGRTQSIQ